MENIIIYLRMESICKKVEDESYKGWIPCLTVRMEAEKTIYREMGKLQIGKISASEVIVTRRPDAFSPLLFKSLCKDRLQDMEIHIARMYKGNVEPFLIYYFYASMLSGFFSCVGKDNTAEEKISIHYSRIKMEYVPWKTGVAGESIFFEYNKAQELQENSETQSTVIGVDTKRSPFAKKLPKLAKKLDKTD